MYNEAQHVIHAAIPDLSKWNKRPDNTRQSRRIVAQCKELYRHFRGRYGDGRRDYKRSSGASADTTKRNSGASAATADDGDSSGGADAGTSDSSSSDSAREDRGGQMTASGRGDEAVGGADVQAARRANGDRAREKLRHARLEVAWLVGAPLGSRGAA